MFGPAFGSLGRERVAVKRTPPEITVRPYTPSGRSAIGETCNASEEPVGPARGPQQGMSKRAGVMGDARFVARPQTASFRHCSGEGDGGEGNGGPSAGATTHHRLGPLRQLENIPVSPVAGRHGDDVGSVARLWRG